MDGKIGKARSSFLQLETMYYLGPNFTGYFDENTNDNIEEAHSAHENRTQKQYHILGKRKQTAGCVVFLHSARLLMLKKVTYMA